MDAELWAWSTCGFRPGLRSGCNSTATATAGWHGSCRRRVSASPQPTTPSLRIADWQRAQDLADGFSPSSCTASSTLCGAMLPGVDAFRTELPLEPDAGGICHRSGFRSADTLAPLYEQLSRGSGAQREGASRSPPFLAEDHAASWRRKSAAASTTNRGNLDKNRLVSIDSRPLTVEAGRQLWNMWIAQFGMRGRKRRFADISAALLGCRARFTMLTWALGINAAATIAILGVLLRGH